MNKLKAIILAPRLDVPFKDFGGPIPSVPDYSGLPPIRRHWDRFVRKLHISLVARDYDVEIITKPLFQFTPEWASTLECDVLYVPHRESHNFPVTSNARVLYYMQTVFPWRFYVDPKGFAGGIEDYPLNDSLYVFNRSFVMGERNAYASYLRSGKSKFEQPESGRWKEKDYILFTCQIPHDQTIMYHSNISVLDALRATLEAAKINHERVVVKGHPVNPGAMMELKTLTLQYENALWMENVSILDAVDNSKCVVTVNSGTGMEALALGKPVLVFGRCEYDCVAMKTTPSTIQKDLKNLIYNDTEVAAFFSMWNLITFDTTL